MSVITILYVVLVVAGIVWIVHRFRVFMRDEKERESRWVMMASDERLGGFLDSLKQEKEGKRNAQTRANARKNSSHATD